MVSAYFLKRIYLSFATHVFDVPARLAAFLLFLLLIFFPVTNPTSQILLLLTLANLGAIFAVSWDLLVGRTGLMSLGHAVFFGLGAYVTALLFVHLGLPPYITIPLSIPVGVLVALIVGFPSLRVKGPYLSLISFAFPLILTGIIYYFKEYTGGERGLYGLPSFFPFLPYKDQFLAEYWFTLLLLFISGVIIYRIANSETGIVLVSILDDELASKASGINVTKYKIMTFVISGIFATIAGSVQAHILRVANTGMLEATISFIPVIVTIFGGIGTLYGPIVGAYFLQLLDGYVLGRIITIPPDWVYAKMLVYALIIIILIILWPRGVARFVTDKLEDLEEARDIDERGSKIWKKYKKKKEKVV